MRTFSVEARRRRLAARQFRSGTVDEIVRDNVVLHSTDPATVFLSLRARNPALARADRADAQARVAERWLARFGPATVDDLQWWTGWSKGHTRTALAAIGAEPAQVDRDGEGVEAWILPGDDGDDGGDAEIRFLPALDGTAMGWRDRRWFLADELRPELFDRWGNVGPTVWRGGEVVGGWGQAPDGEVRWTLLADVGSAAEQAAEDAAAELTAWLDGTVVKPRFPTPLQKRLAR